ncbi:MAG: phenylalanine--tRNA ligase subunit beta [Myxococcota bacterium]
MKVSLNWLSEYVQLPPLEELVHRLTMAGLEVEGVERLGDALRGVVVAKILSSEKHPNADKLSVTKVDVGEAAPLQIVCGAKNYQVGDKVPLATAGTTLPNGTHITASSLRGVESFGMLCSARELGLSQDAAGLVILDPGAPVGAPIAKVLGRDDVVLEVNVTPNRPDALSHLGIAREVAVLSEKPLQKPVARLAEVKERAADKVKIRIEDPERCPRYAARVIEGVTIGPSPAWLASRLEACGVRSINNVVDVTNYVLLEYGQPLHAFDLDQVAGAEIVVRRAKPKEKLTTLDGKERALETDDLLVCDRDKPQVLAGVMGGADSEVSFRTQRVLLECAHFQPATVRRTSKRHGLHSESSHRFERGCDIEAVPEVLDRAAALISELGKGTVLFGRVDVYPSPKPRRKVTLRPGRSSAVLGTEIKPEEETRILEALGFSRTNDAWEVPFFRMDVEREEDLVEEIARVRGYESIPTVMPRAPKALPAESPRMEVERRVRIALAGAGFDEVVNYSFVSPKELSALGAPPPIALVNPLSVEQSVMRTSMFAGLLQNVSRNLRHQVDAGRLYEVGRIYLPDAKGAVDDRPPAHEVLQVAGVLWGGRVGRRWTQKDAPVDFYDAKGAVEAVLEALHLGEARYEAIELAHLHPRAGASVQVKGKRVGSLGELHPRVAKRLDVPAGLVLFELDLGALIEAAALTPTYQPLGRFPAVFRDVAVVVPLELQHDEVRQVIVEVGAPLVEDAHLFDVYTGKPIPEGKKNLAYALKYQASDRTLTDAEVNEAHARIVAEVNRRLGGSLRGANP